MEATKTSHEQAATKKHPWHQSYQQGIRYNIDVEQFSSIGELLEQSFQKYPTKPAFSCMGKTLSYRQIEDMSTSFASYIQNELKLPAGSAVALMMPNILQYPICLFGLLRAGMVVVNVNPLYTARELEHQLKDSGAKAIVIAENFANTLEKTLKTVDVDHVITTKLGDMLGFPKSAIVNFVVDKVKKMVPSFDIPTAKSFLDVLEKGREIKERFKPAKVALDDLAFLQYTGGTTGVSKGAMLSHGNIVANMLQAREWIRKDIIEGEEIVITPLPLYHIFSLTANCFIFSSLGALNVLITNPRDMKGFIKELKKWRFTALTGVNTLFNGLLNQPDFSKLDFSGLKITLGGGMAVQRAVAERWKKVTGMPLIEAYGLTETSPAACINPMDLKDYNGKIGLPIPNTEVAIKDDEGNDVPVGEVGEICIKGPQVMKGYWNRPEETQKVMTNDDYFRSGDMGLMDDKGMFQIVDRKKDMILVSGFNVYPNEIEDVIAQLDEVLEVAAIGEDDEKSGEVVKVFIVKKDQALTEEKVIEHCRENLTKYKVPRYVVFREELPKTNVGKILRKDLRLQ